MAKANWPRNNTTKHLRRGALVHTISQLSACCWLAIKEVLPPRHFNFMITFPVILQIDNYNQFTLIRNAIDDACDHERDQDDNGEVSKDTGNLADRFYRLMRGGQPVSNQTSSNNQNSKMNRKYAVIKGNVTQAAGQYVYAYMFDTQEQAEDFAKQQVAANTSWNVHEIIVTVQTEQTPVKVIDARPKKVETVS